jgi:Sulfotransferase family/Tetratricopeptide repeat
MVGTSEPSTARADRGTEARARDALRRGEPLLAQTFGLELIRTNANAPQTWALDCDIGAALGEWRRSLAGALRAIELGGRSTPNWLRAARAYRALQQRQAVESSLEAAHAEAKSAEAHAALGDFYTQIEEYDRACRAYQEAVCRDPGNERYLFNRAATRRFLGLLEEAERDYDQVIARNPRDWEAYLNRSGLRVQTVARNHVPELEQCLPRSIESWRGEVSIRYALAKELEDLGEYCRSWEHLMLGARARRQHLQYDVRIDVQTVDWIREAFPQKVASGSGDPSTEPIFIVGMPRTGSTLLERILTNQSEVFAAGEMTHLTEAVVAAARCVVHKKDLSRQELVRASAAVDFAALGADYLTRTRARTGRLPHFTDKMPLNYLYCGIIRRALPHAHILHIRRHPLATCYSIYKTLFNQGYPFSYDLTELADYYIGYRRLMEHWRSTMPGEILDVSYEKLVAEPALEAQRVFDFCGLNWDPRYLEFHTMAEPATTASAAQVRRPIYRSSVDLWRHFNAELAPIADRLHAAGIPIAT